MLNTALACMLSLTMATAPVVRVGSPTVGGLSSAQSEALVEARRQPGRLEWRLFETRIGRKKTVLLLGEHHLGRPT
jgi:hypothetical protein